ncbi:DUF1841 family protein [bacterium]|nr:DUF1841 family protein [bacterium]
MFLPEEVDNKTFRLFVQRAWFLQNNHIALSPAEQELVDLILDHPEIQNAFTRKMLDISCSFKPDEENPFALLAALWEINKQVKADKPKGVASIFMNGFPENMVRRERQRRLARAFLRLCRSGEKTISDTKYVHDLEREVYTDFSSSAAEREITGERGAYNIYINNLIHESFSSVSNSFYKEVDNQVLSAGVKLAAAFNRLPSEWIEGMAAGWRRPEKATRKERIQDLCEFLLSPQGFLEISAALSAEERQAAKMVMDNGGKLFYSKLEKAFGGESGDDYYWSQHPPRSVIGRLRYKGLLVIGKTAGPARHYKVAMIPKELHSVVKNL